MIGTVGCAQCTPTMDTAPRAVSQRDFSGSRKWCRPRDPMPAQWTDSAHLSQAVRMGNYNPVRLPETTLRVIYDYMRDLGFPLTITARLDAGMPVDNGVKYTLLVENAIVPGKGLAAEDMTISLNIPADVKVVGATGAGYQKVQHDAKANTDVATWKISKLPAKTPQTFTITLTKAPADQLKGPLRWAKPTMKDLRPTS